MFHIPRYFTPYTIQAYVFNSDDILKSYGCFADSWKGDNHDTIWRFLYFNVHKVWSRKSAMIFYKLDSFTYT